MYFRIIGMRVSDLRLGIVTINIQLESLQIPRFLRRASLYCISVCRTYFHLFQQFYPPHLDVFRVRPVGVTLDKLHGNSFSSPQRCWGILILSQMLCICWVVYGPTSKWVSKLLLLIAYRVLKEWIMSYGYLKCAVFNRTLKHVLIFPRIIHSVRYLSVATFSITG